MMVFFSKLFLPVHKKTATFLVICLFFILIIKLIVVFDSRSVMRLVENREQVIVLTNKGFEPEHLNIKVGESVVWRTERKVPFWPASNIHPTHKIYPEFDAKKPILPGDTWMFQFNRAGIWKFHDHLAAAFTGVITVVGEDGIYANEVCKDKHSVSCWESQLMQRLEEKGVDSTFDLMAELYRSEPQFPEHCHGLAHNVGIAAYKHYIRDPKSVLTPKSSYCAMGFYHGFMEGLLLVTRDIREAKNFCTFVGKELGIEAPDAELQCYHGIGHGAMDMSVTGSKIKDESELVTPALHVCEEASDSPEELYRCASGVFNGIANFYTSGEYGLSVNMADPLALCRVQEAKYKDSCYGNLNTILVWIAGKTGDFVGAGKFIENISEPDLALSAMRYYSNLGNLQFLHYANEKGLDACRKFTSKLIGPCIEGLVQGYLEHGVPGEEYQGALGLCHMKTMTRAEQKVCLNYALGHLKGFYSSTKSEEICSELPADERAYCR